MDSRPATTDEAFEILERLADRNEWSFDTRLLLSSEGKVEVPCIHTGTPVICIELAAIEGIRGACIDGTTMVVWYLLRRPERD